MVPGGGGTFGPVAGGPVGGGKPGDGAFGVAGADGVAPPGVGAPGKNSSPYPTGFPFESNMTPGDIGIPPRSVSVPRLPGGIFTPS